MKLRIFLIVSVLYGATSVAQPPQRSPHENNEYETWEVSVNQMDVRSREKVSKIVEDLQAKGGATRGVMTDILGSMLTGGVTATVDVVATEIINLAKYKKNQKRKWMEMIEKECNYTDSISSIKGLKDFYNEVSTLGALDPSNINFDGISIRGTRNNREVLYMSCHIDTTRLDHMFQHSKFNLILDTLVFHPYECHLPNLQANGIRMIMGERTERDNSFSFDERQNLCIGLEMILSSSWINEAVMVMNDVELGSFKLNVNIDAATSEYIYSRKQIEKNRALGLQRDTSYVQIEGDCFVVPRSYMPISGGKRMWGTGEYRIKVKMRESCQFVNDKDRNKKMKQWYKDYRQLRKMQNKGSLTGEYFKTVWQQNGNTLVKQMLKQGLTTGVQNAMFKQSVGGMQSMMPSGATMGGMPSMSGAPTGSMQPMKK